MKDENKEILENERLEIRLLLEAAFLKYGYDFRNYTKSHLKRRLEHMLNISNMSSYSEMQHRIIYDESYFSELLLQLSINVTEMFRDPLFYKSVRHNVVPYLKTYPHLKIWHAGCSAGQEVYSMRILLEEEGVTRTQIYATDFNTKILNKAKTGIYPLSAIKDYTENYQLAGGLNSFADYYTANYDLAVINKSLRDNVLFSQHNLVTDGVFGEMNIIFCRNVLIYFDIELQKKVVQLFYDTLCPGGFLCIGSKETLHLLDYSDKFEPVDEKQKIYRKKRPGQGAPGALRGPCRGPNFKKFDKQEALRA